VYKVSHLKLNDELRRRHQDMGKQRKKYIHYVSQKNRYSRKYLNTCVNFHRIKYNSIQVAICIPDDRVEFHKNTL